MRFVSLVKLFVIGTLVALMVRFLLVENYQISSESMAPNLLKGDHVLVQKFAYNIRLPFSSYELFKLNRPKRGEVIAFTLPDHGMETFVKRVIALEGEKVEFKEGKWFINGAPLISKPDQPPTERETLPEGLEVLITKETGSAPHYGPVEVPKDHAFVLGDNRPSSVDSRVWGPVPYSCLKGRVKLIWLSSENGKFRTERTGLKVK